MMYPQHPHLESQAADYYDKWLPWAAEEAKKRLADNATGSKLYSAAPQVIEHWKMLVDFNEE